MFTGIIKEVGSILGIESAGGLCRLEVACCEVRDEVAIGDSVAVNGVCLTVTKKTGVSLVFDVMKETIRRTTLSALQRADTVNLEGALRSGASLGGHFVLGHIDCVGAIRSFVKGDGGAASLEIEFPKEFSHLLVEKGSVSIDGVSLTVGETGQGAFKVYLIPHTLKTSTLGLKKSGDRINLEFDIIGKYVAKLDSQRRSGITEDFLKSKGF